MSLPLVALRLRAHSPDSAESRMAKMRRVSDEPSAAPEAPNQVEREPTTEVGATATPEDGKNVEGREPGERGRTVAERVEDRDENVREGDQERPPNRYTAEVVDNARVRLCVKEHDRDEVVFDLRSDELHNLRQALDAAAMELPT